MTVRGAKRLPLDTLQPWLITRPEQPQALDWEEVFHNRLPVEIEVGFGKGTYLVEASKARPDSNFLGIEIDRALVLYVATRLIKRQQTNVRLAQGDAFVLLRDRVPSASVAAIHVYFPDPWWKRRHKKRRLFTSQFAAECERCLAPGGRLLLATDVEEYFGVISQVVLEHTLLRPVEVLDQPLDAPACETNFERKARLKGTAVWRAIYQKGPNSARE